MVVSQPAPREVPAPWVPRGQHQALGLDLPGGGAGLWPCSLVQGFGSAACESCSAPSAPRGAVSSENPH